MKGEQIAYKIGTCTGCQTCENVCPTNAISMKENAEGFMVPSVNPEQCIDCHLCQKRCPANAPKFPVLQIHPTLVFQDKQNDNYLRAASGGAFGVIAREILNRGGIVAGCEMDADYRVKHIVVQSLKELKKLHGSKYVQSNIDSVYKECKTALDNGKWVFFTGCPCQVDGLKHYLNKDYDHLITADLICHGVPPQKMFSEFINYFFKQSKHKNYSQFKFRHKPNGNGDENKVYNGFKGDNFFMKYFLWGDLYRPSCYNCRYAGNERVGDFTLGDFWENFKINLPINDNESWSKIVLNNAKSLEWKPNFQNNGIVFELTPTQTDLTNRGPLKEPSRRSFRRDVIFLCYRVAGVKAVDWLYQANKILLKVLHK